MDSNDLGNPCWSRAEDDFRQERAAYNRLSLRYEKLLKALQKIAYSSHCIYGDSGSPYSIGVADGHRCAAQIARLALQENDEH